MMQAGSFEEERSLGEDIELTNASASLSILPNNAAKCSGADQDQRRLIGTLNCKDAMANPTGSKRIANPFRPNKCPDNLSAGAAWMCSGNSPDGYCLDFATNGVVGRMTKSAAVQSSTSPTSCQGVTTKAVVAHPHGTGKKVGVLAFKRVKCNTSVPPVCAVYKVVQCITHPTKNQFRSRKEVLATADELKKFAKLAKANAWDNPGTPTASIKLTWRCSDENQRKADGWARAF